MFVHTILQALNKNRRTSHRKLTDTIYPEPPASDDANVRSGLVWFFVVVLAALSFALI